MSIQNEILNAIASRRSCRAYKPEQITAEELEAVTARHREIGAWNTPLTMEKAALERLETVMTQAGELTDDQWVDFDKLVDNHWAAAAR